VSRINRQVAGRSFFHWSPYSGKQADTLFQMIRYQLARTTVFVSLHMDCVYMYAEARQARHMRGLPSKTPAAGRLCRFTTLLGSCPINVKLGPNSALHLIYRVLAASWWNSTVIARISGMSSDGSQEEGIATGWLQIHTHIHLHANLVYFDHLLLLYFSVTIS
jgi:hypothetical protein